MEAGTPTTENMFVCNIKKKKSIWADLKSSNNSMAKEHYMQMNNIVKMGL